MIYDVKIKLNSDETAFLAEILKEEDGICTRSVEHVPSESLVTNSQPDGFHDEFNYE